MSLKSVKSKTATTPAWQELLEDAQGAVDQVHGDTAETSSECRAAAATIESRWLDVKNGDSTDTSVAEAFMDAVDAYQMGAKRCGYRPLKLEQLVAMYGVYCGAMSRTTSAHGRALALSAQETVAAVRTTLDVLADVYRTGKVAQHIAVVHYTTELRSVFKRLMAVRLRDQASASELREAQLDILRAITEILEDHAVKKRLSEANQARLSLARQVPSFVGGLVGGGARKRTRRTARSYAKRVRTTRRRQRRANN